MQQVTVTAARWQQDSDGAWLCLRVQSPSSAMTICDEIKPDKQYVAQIRRKGRSLDANAYAWVLITAIADELRASKDEIYFDMLKKYGQGELISVKTGIDINGFVKYSEVAGYGKVNGVEFTHYRVYKGSSEYDTREMSIFIDGIVSEAQVLGIDTRTPEEIAEIKSLWENEK